MEELTVGTRIDHEKYGQGIISKVNLTNFEVFFETKGRMELSKMNQDYEIVDMPESSGPRDGLNLAEVEEAISYVLEKHGIMPSQLPVGEKWIGGRMILQPSNPELKPKDIPVETFFHKIVMLRDSIRVMEQKINSNSGLADEEKVQLQQYITKMYGSLTTFNILFADKEDHFKGASKS